MQFLDRELVGPGTAGPGTVVQELQFLGRGSCSSGSWATVPGPAMTSLMTSADPAWRRSAARRASSSAQPLWGIAGTYLAICAREGRRARAPARAARRGALVVQELLAEELPGAGTAGPGTAAQELRSRNRGPGTCGPGTAVQELIAPRGSGTERTSRPALRSCARVASPGGARRARSSRSGVCAAVPARQLDRAARCRVCSRAQLQPVFCTRASCGYRTTWPRS